ncbi:MAG: hypothetical protein ACKOC6_02260 [bacterium]
MATTTTAKKQAKQAKDKTKAEVRRRLDEIKALATRQSYITEEQLLFLLDPTA